MKHLVGVFCCCLVLGVVFSSLFCFGFVFKFQHSCFSPSASNRHTADMDGFLIRFPLQVAVEM